MITIGIDIGGSSVKAVLTEIGARTIATRQVSSRSGEGPGAVIDVLHGVIASLMDEAGDSRVEGIGVGMAGTIDIDEGVVYHPPNFAKWDAVPLASRLSERWHVPVRLDNDANCAALGESWYGAGRGLDSFVGMTLGTGVGGGIIVNGAVYHGTRGFAGEIGHVSIDYNGPECNCGGRGCIEAYVGIGYLMTRALPLLENDATSGLHERAVSDPGSLTPRDLTEAALEGDTTAAGILSDTGTKLGCAAASVANLLDITTFLIGGGISGAGDLIVQPMLLSARSRVLEVHRDSLEVRLAELGNDAGMLGAAALLRSGDGR
jgi:glucokinase